MLYNNEAQIVILRPPLSHRPLSTSVIEWLQEPVAEMLNRDVCVSSKHPTDIPLPAHALQGGGR